MPLQPLQDESAKARRRRETMQQASLTDTNAAFVDTDKPNVKIYFLTVPKRIRDCICSPAKTFVYGLSCPSSCSECRQHLVQAVQLLFRHPASELLCDLPQGRGPILLRNLIHRHKLRHFPVSNHSTSPMASSPASVRTVTVQ